MKKINISTLISDKSTTPSEGKKPCKTPVSVTSPRSTESKTGSESEPLIIKQIPKPEKFWYSKTSQTSIAS